MTEAKPTVSEYTIKPLGPDTWDAFAQLAERHNGVWGGCWCTWFHPRRAVQDSDVEAGRPYKERLVRQGRAHAALVFDGEVAGRPATGASGIACGCVRRRRWRGA